MFRRIAFIVNPAAGRKNNKSINDRITRVLQSMNAQFVLAAPKSESHTTDLARTLASDHDAVIAVGGDGTVNRVANGIIGSAAALGVIPNGSGNDFASLMRIPLSVDGSCRVVARGWTTHIDIGRFALKREASGYFLNTLGIGFNAAVAYETQSIRWMKGIPLYVAGIARTLRSFKPMEFEIRPDSGPVLKKRCFLLCIGNGNREGSGFRITPKADPTDGRLDVCVIQSIPRRRMPSMLIDVLRGHHTERLDVNYFKVTTITINGDGGFPVHADGEVYSYAARRIDVEVIPKGLEVITGQL